MKTLLILFIMTSVFTCEKPSPQKPKVIYSNTEIIQSEKDSILSVSMDSINLSSDSLVLDSTQPNQE